MSTAITAHTPISEEHIDNLIDKLFRSWVRNGEKAWARYAWSLLGRRGLTQVDSITTRNDVLLRLLALRSIYFTFSCRMYGDGYSGDALECCSELSAEEYGFSWDWLRSLCQGVLEGEELENAELVHEEAFLYVIPTEVAATAPNVADSLRRELCDYDLLASLIASCGDAEYPLSEDARDDAIDEVSQAESDIYSWISTGMWLDV